MPRLLASETESGLHHLVAFVGGHGIDVHSVWVFLFSLEVESSTIVSLVFLVVRRASSSSLCLCDGALHAYEIVLELDRPVVPFFKSRGRCRKVENVFLQGDRKGFAEHLRDSVVLLEFRSGYQHLEF